MMLTFAHMLTSFEIDISGIAFIYMHMWSVDALKVFLFLSSLDVRLLVMLNNINLHWLSRTNVKCHLWKNKNRFHCIILQWLNWILQCNGQIGLQLVAFTNILANENCRRWFHICVICDMIWCLIYLKDLSNFCSRYLSQIIWCATETKWPRWERKRYEWSTVERHVLLRSVAMRQSSKCEWMNMYTYCAHIGCPLTSIVLVLIYK